MRHALLRGCSILLLAQQPRAVAADATASLHERAEALHAIGQSCSRDDLPVLSRLAQPYIGPWLVWHGALDALSHCAFEEMAPFWRDMLTFPRLPVRQVAIVGLLRTGSTGDLELIHEAMHREQDPAMVRWAGRAESILQHPVAERGALLPR